MGMPVSVHVALKQEPSDHPDCLLIKWMISFAIIIFRQCILLLLSRHLSLNVNHQLLDALYSSNLVPNSCCFEKG